MLTGNKGEWSEIYVFLKLLADGRLNAADSNLNILPDVYYPIIKILRQESGILREYIVDQQIKIIDGSNGSELFNLNVSEFVNRSIDLFAKLRNSEGRSFQFEDIEEFLSSIDVNSLTAVSTDKSDINIIVHDLSTGLKPKLGFSIKSMLGGSSTLFNPGNTTNFIFEIIGMGELNFMEINEIVSEPKITNRISKFKSMGFNLKFVNIQSSTLQLNLQLIDGSLPEILAELLLLRYASFGSPVLSVLLAQLTEINPLNFDLSMGHPFYEYKVKNFLTDSALGMTPATTWTGKYDATGGIIIVKSDGELVCYHIYNRNEFQTYLLNNTKLEQASTSRYNFGELYQDNGRFFIKLNLQIRFKAVK
ncbi:MAG: HpaII family restriction endonuclease [Bacteroidota bacterium]|nr:HpaII family restriction endonuclease [Bacteroidota bacterium]